MRTHLRIGIADDNPELREILTQLIPVLGHDISCVAEDGEQILTMIGQREVDLALIDLDMPVFDGLAVAEELSRIHGIPVILMSGHADLHHVVRENEPIRAYLRKPFTLEALKVAIEAATCAH